MITQCVVANFTPFLLGKIAANRAKMHRFFGGDESLGKFFDLCRRHIEDFIRVPLSGFLPYARQLAELIDKACNRIDKLSQL